MLGSVTKHFEFSAAHILPNHPGKCKNLHGHNYQVKVTVSGPIDEETGMIIDFGDLKEAAKHYIDAMDHSFIYAGVAITEDEAAIVNLLKKLNKKVFRLLTKQQTTAENISHFLASHILEDIKDNFDEDDSIGVNVTVYETSTSSAEVFLSNYF